MDLGQRNRTPCPALTLHEAESPSLLPLPLNLACSLRACCCWNVICRSSRLLRCWGLAADPRATRFTLHLFLAGCYQWLSYIAEVRPLQIQFHVQSAKAPNMDIINKQQLSNSRWRLLAFAMLHISVFAQVHAHFTPEWQNVGASRK